MDFKKRVSLFVWFGLIGFKLKVKDEVEWGYFKNELQRELKITPTV